KRDRSPFPEPSSGERLAAAQPPEESVSRELRGNVSRGRDDLRRGGNRNRDVRDQERRGRDREDAPGPGAPAGAAAAGRLLRRDEPSRRPSPRGNGPGADRRRARPDQRRDPRRDAEDQRGSRGPDDAEAFAAD